jgi:hypothetical protein
VAYHIACCVMIFRLLPFLPWVTERHFTVLRLRIFYLNNRTAADTRFHDQCPSNGTANTYNRRPLLTPGSGHRSIVREPAFVATLGETVHQRRNFQPSKPRLAVDRCPASTLTDRLCLSWRPSCFPNPATVSPICHVCALEP